MLLPRALEEVIINRLKYSNKAVIIYGPRQVGKTTLIKQIIQQLPYRVLIINADEKRYLEVLSSRDLRQLSSLVSGYQLLFIDEAQRITEIGINLKIIIDNIPQLKLVVTGSSSFDLAGKVSEPLTGRAWVHNLYPISFFELSELYNSFELKSQLEERLVFGAYPEIFSLGGEEKKQYLEQLTRSYLYKDVLALTTIKYSSQLQNLLKLLAFQIGFEVSLTELGTQLSMSKDTVARYIDLLEKSFVLFRLSGLNRNLRKEVSKMDKIYFYDLGVRNIIIDNLKPLADRNDQGQLWENFLIIERLKFLAYSQTLVSRYFWRTYTGAELDYIEEREEKFYAYEFKWGRRKSTPSFKSWNSIYPDSKLDLITQDNYFEFITGKS